MVRESGLRSMRVMLITLAIVGLVFAAAGTMQLSYAKTSVFTESEFTKKPPELVLNTTELIFSNYEQIDYNFVIADGNELQSVASSDTDVVVARLWEGDALIQVVGAGNTVVTITDIYSQTATVSVEVTQQFMDDLYLDKLKDICDTVYYGDEEIWFFPPFEGVTAKVEINGKTYSGKYRYKTNLLTGEREIFCYEIAGIPLLKVGTTIHYTLQKGESVFSDTITVQKGQLDDEGLLCFYDDSLVYDGKPQKPALKVVFFNKNNIRNLKEGTDYVLTYSNNKNVGWATFRATGINNYTGTVTERIAINPKGTSISKVKAAKKGFTVKWKKQAEQTTGYQIQYSLKKNFKGAKTVTVGKTKTVSKKIKKLKAKKTYYIRIRTYKTVGGHKFYSPWSTAKKVKTK